MPTSPPPPSSANPQTRKPPTSYRTAQPIPTALLDHSTTDLEEGLYTQALSLLSSCLSSGISASNTKQPVRIPPPGHLALVATLSVHPSLTSRTKDPDKHAAADAALEYLRQINALVGPRGADLGKAFQFTDAGNGASSSRDRRAKSRISDLELLAEDDVGRVRSPYADSGSLWSHAGDFWRLCGWAFNCSVLYPARWERWEGFLSFMLDVLENDVALRSSASKGADVNGEEDSLLAQYLRPIGEGRNSKRRVMRAILADGSSKSLSEFAEVWRQETRPPKHSRHDDELTAPITTAKRRKLDLQNGEYGDYFDESDQDTPSTSTGPTPRSRSTTSFPNLLQPNTTASPAAEESSEDELSAAQQTPQTTLTAAPYGDTTSLKLRRRLVALLTTNSTLHPHAFLDTEDLFDLFTEFLRPLPLQIFAAFLSPPKPYLSPSLAVSLNQMLLRPLLAATAPQYNENALSQAEFEVHYAPFPANSGGAEDNAKVSLLVEGLLRLLWSSGMLSLTARLRVVVETGIKARRERVVFDGRRKVGTRAVRDEEAGVVLKCSAEKMLMVLDMAN